MLKFFRKIRYDLMEKNKTGKYLKYAIGEILLVMIGILLALQVNNWNDSRNGLELQKQFIQNIKEDLLSDKANLEDVISIQKEKHSYTQILLGEIPNSRKNDKDYLDSLMYSVLDVNPTFFPVIGSYQSALSSGKLAQLENNPSMIEIAKLYDNHFSRLLYNGELLDDRFFAVGELYKYERRTKQLGNMTESQYSEFLDNIYWFDSMIQFYLNRCDETLQQINKILE